MTVSPKISVIVPIYGVEKYLCQCVDSILAQTLTDIEIILVDDGSPDNCGKIAFAAMLPTVIEESMASYKGVKMAKEAGLKEPLIKNLKKFYGKALLSYAGYAVVTGLSVFAASKIMEIFTRPKKVTTSYDSNFDNSFPSKSNTRRDFRSSFW